MNNNNPRELDNLEDISVENFEVEQERVESANNYWNIFNWPRKFWVILAFFNVLSICFTIWLKSFMWLPKKRNLCDDNIFSKNSLVISDDELNKLIYTLENELEITISDEDKFLYHEIGIPVFRDIITKKYLEDDPNRVAYFYNELLLVNVLIDDEYNNYVDGLFEFGINKKAYFSSELKQQLAEMNNNDALKVYKITKNEK